MPAPTSHIDLLNAALQGRYQVQRELGAGGMATVYLARDMKHGRDVALKVLKPELAAVLGAQRFLKEIQVTANLQHPHILPLHDSGDAGGQLFYVMPLVKGETLRERLNAAKMLPLEEAVRIARQVAGALEFAHRQGVIHRDIKPENILLHEGEAILADFGIALAVREAGGDRLTETGLSLGTPHYMSPEQATGEREIDARSDVYSLGAVTYEMIAGEPPVTGASARAMIVKLLTERPTSLSALRDTVPPALDAAVMRALAKEPTDRFASAREFGDALDAALRVRTEPVPVATQGTAAPRVTARNAVEPGTGARTAPARFAMIALAAVVVVAGGVWLWRRGASAPAAGTAIRSIAVLPFVDRSAGAGEVLGDGIAETLIFALGKVPGLKVAAQTSAFTFKGKEADLATIGDKLGVASVLTGSVQRAGTKLRVTVRLEDVATHAERWTEQYDREMSDVFALQDDIARAVVAKLQAGVTGTPAATIVNAGTKNVDAYQAYLQGRFMLNQRGEGLRAAAPQFERAVALDSMYALAWVGLADYYMLQRAYAEISSAEAVPKFERALGRALEIDPTLAAAHSAKAFWLQTYAYDFPGAEREFRAAIALDSADVSAHYWFGVFLSGAMFRTAEGLVEVRKAVALDPLSGHAASQLALVLLQAKDTAAAVAEARRSVALNPNWQNYRVLGRLLSAAGKRQESVAAYDSSVNKSGRSSWALYERAALAGRMGDLATANSIRRELEALHASGRAGGVAVGGVTLWTSGADEAVRWLERARAEHDALLSWPNLAVNLGRGAKTTPAWMRFWKSFGVADSVLVSTAR